MTKKELEEAIRDLCNASGQSVAGVFSVLDKLRRLNEVFMEDEHG